MQINHPLMKRELTNIKDTAWLHHRLKDNPEGPPDSTLASVDASHTHVHPPIPTNTPIDLSTLSWAGQPSIFPEDEDAQLDEDLQRLSPLLLSLPQSLTPQENHQAAFRRFLRTKLPDEKEAYRLWGNLRQNALWQRRPHSIQTSFFTKIFDHCYNAPISSLDQSCLSLIFMMFSIGCAVDLNIPIDAATSNGAYWHRIARSAMFMGNTFTVPNVESVIALFYDVWYVCGFSETKDTSAARGIMGLAVTLAQKVDLRPRLTAVTILTSSSFLYIAKIRRQLIRFWTLITTVGDGMWAFHFPCINLADTSIHRLFWELFQLDAGFAIYFNGLPMLSPVYFACPRPIYEVNEPEYPDNTSVHIWRHELFLECLAPAAEVNARTDTSYEDMLDVDARIRDFLNKTKSSAIQNGDVDTQSVWRQLYWADLCMDGALLKLHQSYFTKGLADMTEPGASSPYMSSVVAVFLSACRLINTIFSARDHDPALISRFSPYGHNLWNSMVRLIYAFVRSLRCSSSCLGSPLLISLQSAVVMLCARGASDARTLSSVLSLWRNFRHSRDHEMGGMSTRTQPQHAFHRLLIPNRPASKVMSGRSIINTQHGPNARTRSNHRPSPFSPPPPQSLPAPFKRHLNSLSAWACPDIHTGNL
jgi:hypothetical protein